jgi:CMP-N,N'-diacetyllegionaminic acid synthase
MYQGKTFLAIIPSRSGSKRLVNKNILDLNGKPLIEWTILESLKSKYLDDILVTSNCNVSLDIAKKHNINTIKRPEELASDTAICFDYIKHAIKNSPQQYDYIVLLQATSPLRTVEHIDSAIELVFEKDAKSVISVSKMTHNPLWSNTLDATASMKDFVSKELANTRSQDLPQYYRLNGAIYISETDSLLKTKDFFQGENSYAYIMSERDGIDIDTELDYEVAKIYHQKLSNLNPDIIQNSGLANTRINKQFLNKVRFFTNKWTNIQ